MELEGLKMGLKHLENAGLPVENLITNIHGMVKRFMREEHEDKNHFLLSGMVINIPLLY